MGKSAKPKPDAKSGTKDKVEKPVRKVFVAFKVKRVSDIDNLKEHFKLKFHIYFNWLPTLKEYESYCEAKREDKLLEWTPNWYPHLEYLNQIELLKQEWEKYPEVGKFRMLRLKGFFKNCCDDRMVYDPIAKDNDEKRVELGEWSDDRAYFIRAKLEIELFLSEELELQAFPFDCQDLSVVMREETRDVRLVFIPEMRKLSFGSIDPRFSVICEWDMESARIEFGTSNPVCSSFTCLVFKLVVPITMEESANSQTRYIYLWCCFLYRNYLERGVNIRPLFYDSKCNGDGRCLCGMWY